MGEYKNKAYTLRIDNELMEKVREIAALEDRPINKQIERIIRNYLENSENTTKTIKIGRDNNGNISM